LYGAWLRIKSRVAGTHDRKKPAYWKGLAIEFSSWEHFRSWSLANGFNVINNSIDRIDSDKGYSPANCRWVPVAENSMYASIKRWATT